MKAAQIINVTAVTGIVHAQYVANFSVSDQPIDGTENRAAKNVAGKKVMVRIAIVFIEELSFAVASARALLALATSILILESSWVRNANNYGIHVSNKSHLRNHISDPSLNLPPNSDS